MLIKSTAIDFHFFFFFEFRGELASPTTQMPPSEVSTSGNSLMESLLPQAIRGANRGRLSLYHTFMEPSRSYHGDAQRLFTSQYWLLVVHSIMLYSYAYLSTCSNPSVILAHVHSRQFKNDRKQWKRKRNQRNDKGSLKGRFPRMP